MTSIRPLPSVSITAASRRCGSRNRRSPIADGTALQLVHHRRLPTAAAAETGDRRSRHGTASAARASPPASHRCGRRNGDRRSRHGTARQLVHHRRLPAASLGRSTVTAETECPTMAKQTEPVICRFYRLFPDAPLPRRADRSADGMLPTRGYRYCEALASASAFGWYIYPPLNFSLVWDGIEIADLRRCRGLVSAAGGSVPVSAAVRGGGT